MNSVFIVYESLSEMKDLRIYINGVDDGFMSMMRLIDLPQDGIFLGSDNIDELFIGEI